MLADRPLANRHSDNGAQGVDGDEHDSESRGTSVSSTFSAAGSASEQLLLGEVSTGQSSSTPLSSISSAPGWIVGSRSLQSAPPKEPLTPSPSRSVSVRKMGSATRARGEPRSIACATSGAASSAEAALAKSAIGSSERPASMTSASKLGVRGGRAKLCATVATPPTTKSSKTGRRSSSGRRKMP
jgi:hypothetical protein